MKIFRFSNKITLFLIAILGLIGLAAYIAGINNESVFYEMAGSSMTPTFVEGDFIEAKDIPVGEVKRGDVVIFTSPFDQDLRLVKRVVGLPGDTVEVVDKKVIVITTNGEEYTPTFDEVNTSTGPKSTVVEPDSFYVLGDNRRAGASLDSSNDFGLLPFENLLGVSRSMSDE